MNESIRKTAVVPGSFDPMTLGHRALIEQALARYENVYVAVMTNYEKQPLLDVSTRVKIAELTLSDLPYVKVIADDGLLVDLFDRLHADAVCKGYRNEIDLDYEKTQDEWNCAHNSNFFTDLIPAEPGTEGISSTLVRGRLEKGEPVNGLVADAAIPLLQKAFAKEKRK